MKKLWNSNIQSWNPAAQLKQSWNPAEASAASPQAQPTGQQQAPAAPATGEKQFLRLPLESARKLRWYDKGDLQALVKTHLRDKSDLMDTITALKKLLIRSGMTDSQLDVETRQLLGDVELMQEADAGVNSVLLASAEGELEALQEKVDQLQQELVAARSKCGLAPQFSIGGDEGGDGMRFLHAPPPMDAELAARLAAAVEQLDRSTAASASLSRQLRSQELYIAERETEEAMRSLMAARAAPAEAGSDEGSEGSSEGGDEGGAEDLGAARRSGGGDGADDKVQHLRQQVRAERDQRLALVAKLQRLEVQRRSATDELDELTDQLRVLQGAAGEADALRGELAAVSARGVAAEAAYEATSEQLVVLRMQLRTAEELAEKRLADLRKHQAAGQGAEALRKYQDICLEAEERAAHAERRCAMAEVRGSKLEVALREAQQEARAAAKAAATGQRDLEALQAKLIAAEAAAAAGGAARSAGESRAAADAAAAARAVEAARGGEEDLRAAQRDAAVLRAQLGAAEGRLQAAEASEARVMAEQQQFELADAEREELAAQVLALRERLADSRAEKGQLEHYKLVASQLEAARVRVEGELVVTAQLATQLEARLRDMLAKVDGAETSASIAESRARAAEATITSEVEMRLAAACSNRSYWPLAIREEVSRLESHHEAAQATLATVKAELESESRLYRAEARQKAELQRHCVELDDRVQRLEREGATRLREVELALSAAQHAADVCRGALTKLEQEHEAYVRGTAGLACNSSLRLAGRRPSLTNGSLGGDAGSALQSQGSVEISKWQVQNRVGGGSLYGISDSAPLSPGLSQAKGPSASHPANGNGPSASPFEALAVANAPAGGAAGGGAGRGGRDKMDGPDILYLKNVLLKFLEAHVSNRVQERDVLLPAVATLLQATPQEFKVLRKLMTNTTPPSMQMLSVLGWKIGS